ncbi:MAG: PDZ domain-containing protein [Flavobacteriales bacterium]|nr:PDZ domain-containing protein [Flavobacteriales bacterium]
MDRSLLPFGLSALCAALIGIAPTWAQSDRKVRIEVIRTENGETSRISRELNMNDEEDLRDALRDLGVLEELNNIGEGEDLVIDLRRMKDGGMLDEMSVAMALEELTAEEPAPTRAYLGVYYGNYNENECEDRSKRPPVKEGCALTGVIGDQPADRAGLRAGDIVVRMDDREIKRGSDLVEALRRHAPGDKVKVTYYRGKEKRTTEVVLGEQEDEDEVMRFNWSMPPGAWPEAPEAPEAPQPFLGITGGEYEGGEGGVRIGEVTPGSAAERMGLREGDVIRALNGEDIEDFAELADRIGDMEPGEAVRVDVERDGQRMELAGELGTKAPEADVFRIEPFMGMEAPFISPMPPMPPMPAPDAPDMSAEDRAAFEREMAEYQRAMEEYAREMAEMSRARSEQDEEREAYRREMDELRREMDRLRRELRTEVTREVRVTVRSMSLSAEETAVLKGKGVAHLESSLGLTDLRIAPNPGDGEYRISFTVPQRGDLTVDVHNSTGERVYHETITGFKGSYERVLDLTDLPAGAYFLVIGQGTATEARKLIKQ